MGQPIKLLQKPSSTPRTVRFEINRYLTGMGHERYQAGQPIEGDRPPDRLARAIFEQGGVESIHVYGNIITLTLVEGREPRELAEAIEGLYIFYRPGVEVVMPEGAAAGS